jgi:hypothetical protein
MHECRVPPARALGGAWFVQADIQILEALTHRIGYGLFWRGCKCVSSLILSIKLSRSKLQCYFTVDLQ